MGTQSLFDTLSIHITWAPHWLIATALIVAIVSAGIVAQAIGAALLVRASKSWHPLLQHIFIKSRGIGRLAIFIIAARAALPILPLPAPARASADHAIIAMIIILIGWVVYAAVDIAIERYIQRLRFDTADNLLARKAATQMKVLRRAANIMIVLVTVGLALMTFDAVRQYGVSLFASAGVAGLVAGLAARPVLSNLIAGVQIALTQPIRMDDVVVVEGEWGRIEEITATFVVIRIWDLRRLIVPLSYFLEKPFANWTHTSSAILGYVYLYTDYSIDVAAVREKAMALIKAAPQWDGEVASVQVTDANAQTMEIRVLMGARDSSAAWDMRCNLREALVAYVQAEFPNALPRTRAEFSPPPHPLQPGPQGPPQTGATPGT